MSELCDFKIHFFSLLFCDLIRLCTVILSQPLYFSYFIFFSPYLLKLISFLIPLFITTFLLFLAFLTAIVRENFFCTEPAQSSLIFAYTSLFESLKKDENEDRECLENLEMYEIVFCSSLIDEKLSQGEILEAKIEESTGLQVSESTMIEGSIQDGESTTLDALESSVVGTEDKNHEEPFSDKCGFMDIEKDPTPIHAPEQENTKCSEKEEKRMENFLKILDEFERMSSNVEEKKKFRRPLGSISNKVVEKQKASNNGSKAEGNNNDNSNNNIPNKINATATFCVDSTHDDDDGKGQKISIVKAYSERITSSKNGVEFESSRNLVQNLGSYGSMRQEKEWKRTLACKLFEERHNVDGGDGMDSLWEAYDANDSVKSRTKNDKYSNNKKKKNKNKIEECEEEEEIDGQLCCLQALKISSGKVNLGIGRRNLVRISKAIKGFGWLHHMSKKVHNNGDIRY